MRKSLATALLLPRPPLAPVPPWRPPRPSTTRRRPKASTGQQTVSIYVDVDWGARKSGSAGELNQAHKAFNANGYQVIDVVGYTENGDLQGFFVTYVRR